jgi:hypothetical protein
MMSPAIHMATNVVILNQVHVWPAFRQLTAKQVNLILCASEIDWTAPRTIKSKVFRK